uniref:Sey1/RHD3-like three-helix bundle domain-containing protein n=1 Tax=Aegilops tauschii subsp. strangulata TaxID=200361 RepID=A0A453P3P4_AEGTS
FLQEAHRRSNNSLPPAWTILVLAILGFNESMFLLRNPVYILGLFLAFVLSYAVWLQYDIWAYFRHGTVSGLITISSSLLPTIMDIVTAIINMSHRKKHSLHRSRRALPYHAQSLSNQSHQHAEVHYHASPDTPSSVDSSSGSDS